MSDSVAAAWQKLAGLARPTLAELFAEPGRVASLSAKLDLPSGAIRFDWSKTHLDAAHLAGFTALADAVGFKRIRGAMFAGEKINVTEGRAVEHTALRGVGRESSVAEAEALHARMAGLVAAIHGGALGEVRRWKVGLEHHHSEARPFYLTIAAAILAGLGVVLLPKYSTLPSGQVTRSAPCSRRRSICSTTRACAGSARGIGFDARWAPT